MDEPPADRLHGGGVDTPLPRRPEAPGGRAQRRRDRARRHGLRPPGCLRLRHRDAAHRPPGRRRCTASTASTSRPSAHRPGPRSSRAATTTRSAWASWPTSPWPSRATRAASRSRRPRCRGLPRDAGYSTIAVGKWHLTPRWQRSAAGPFDSWPLGLGFERYYGFLQGDTNHWTPNLVRDNHYIDPPRRPEDGYHLSEDLADQAIRMLQDQQQGAPGKPFFLYFALGAMHAPHHVAPEWVDPYRGVFDRGWDAWRDEVFARQVASGIVPEGTVLTRRPEWVRAWSDLLGRRAAHAQPPAGGLRRLPHPHRRADRPRARRRSRASARMDNTLVVVFSDNGASAEGGQQGSFNEHRFTAHVRESLAENLDHYDDWGGFSTYNHYSWAWAWAGNTPHKLWKRYTWLGGTRTPLIVHWAGRRRTAGPCARPVRARHRPDADDHGRRRARRARRRSTACPSSRSTGQPARHARRPGGTRAAPHAVLRDDGLPLHLPRGLEGDDQPHRARASSTRRSSPSAAATSTRTAGSCSTCRWTSPRRRTAPRTSPSAWAG